MVERRKSKKGQEKVEKEEKCYKIGQKRWKSIQKGDIALRNVRSSK